MPLFMICLADMDLYQLVSWINPFSLCKFWIFIISQCTLQYNIAFTFFPLQYV
jgi:hypothetical protein